MLEFTRFPSIKRFSRDIIITEKLDGTNAQIYIELRANVPQVELNDHSVPFMSITKEGIDYVVLAGSRTRWLGRGKDDNFGFADWVGKHLDELLTLGPGKHFGEWYGAGIQRKYGLDHKRFALFNVSRWGGAIDLPKCCETVPILYKGEFYLNIIDATLNCLRNLGSSAVTGFMNPEGIVVYHTAANVLFKKTLSNDEKGKQE